MEFLFVFVICPVIIVTASIAGNFLFNKWFIVPLLTFIVFTILTFTIFNASFFFWAAVFTILSMIVSFTSRIKRKQPVTS